MNPLALLLLVAAVVLGIGGAILAGTTGAALNVLWLLGLAAVLASLFIQTVWPIVTHHKESK